VHSWALWAIEQLEQHAEPAGSEAPAES
jgi:hypothetical protein